MANYMKSVWKFLNSPIIILVLVILYLSAFEMEIISKNRLKMSSFDTEGEYKTYYSFVNEEKHISKIYLNILQKLSIEEVQKKISLEDMVDDAKIQLASITRDQSTWGLSSITLESPNSDGRYYLLFIFKDNKSPNNYAQILGLINGTILPFETT